MAVLQAANTRTATPRMIRTKRGTILLLSTRLYYFHAYKTLLICELVPIVFRISPIILLF